MISIAQDAQGPAVVRPWLEKAGTTFRTLVDQHNELGKAFLLKYVPVAVIVDADGRLVRPITGVNIGDDGFRAELEAWATTGDVPAAWRDTEAPEHRPLSQGEREADARLQLALVLLEMQRTKEALEQLRLAVQADPENWLIRKQMWAIETPGAFYDGPVDYAWQKAQRQREDEGFLRQ